MKRATTLLAALLTGLLSVSSVQASPFLLFDQLLGSADAVSGEQRQHILHRASTKRKRAVQQQGGKGGNPNVTTLESNSHNGSGYGGTFIGFGWAGDKR